MYITVSELRAMSEFLRNDFDDLSILIGEDTRTDAREAITRYLDRYPGRIENIACLAMIVCVTLSRDTTWVYGLGAMAAKMVDVVNKVDPYMGRLLAHHCKDITRDLADAMRASADKNAKDAGEAVYYAAVRTFLVARTAESLAGFPVVDPHWAALVEICCVALE